VPTPHDNPPALARQSRPDAPLPMQLLLFVDERSRSQEPTRRIHNYLLGLQQEYPFGFQVIGVERQPHLVEHYRLVATPSLVRVSPQPRQVIAGRNLVEQLQNCWEQWVDTAENSDPAAERDESGALSASDRSELIQLSDEVFRLQRENEELNEQLRFKDQVLAMLAHDLRNPLTAAAIAFETLELADSNGSDQSTLLKQQIGKQAQNQFRIMNRMITDILQTARSKSSGLYIQPQHIQLQPLCAEVLQQFTPAFQSKALAIDTDIPQDLPAAYADEELIRQVLVNLLDNAVKYTPAGGKVHVSVLHRTTQKIQISICDDGPGIPDDRAEDIFDGHVRLERDADKDGYGLGLSLCRQVVRAHYGHIWVTPAPERGSCFHFTLPVYQL